jgi:steroid delta-isomerase-like uncharacterized protein
MSTADHKALVHRVVAAANQSDWDAVEQLFAADYVDHDRGRTGLPPGPAGVKLAWQGFRAAFPDLEFSVADIIAEGDLVVVRGEMRGTHQGELMGIPATGRVARVTVIDFNRIANGQVAERWAEADTVGMLQQLGVIPGAPGSEQDEGRPVVPAPVADEDSDSEASKALLQRYAEVLLNGHELERAGEILAPDYVGHFPGTPAPVRGIEGWQANFGGFLAAFPDYRETVHAVVAEGDRAAARVTFHGTHRGDLMGVPPTGKEISAGGMAIVRVAKGRVIEQWIEADLAGMMQQLGVAPASA